MPWPAGRYLRAFGDDQSSLRNVAGLGGAHARVRSHHDEMSEGQRRAAAGTTVPESLAKFL